MTFKERFEYVKELITKIRRNSGSDFDILVAVNANNEEEFDESYRSNMINFCSSIPKCFPIVCPTFKSLPKLWNTLSIFSKTEYNFFICDDVEYGPSDCLAQALDFAKKSKEEFFTINGGFSFFVITKTMLRNLNYFDERLCGYGEEDGDIIHSYILKYGKNLPLLRIDTMVNKALYDVKNKNIENHVDNKPRFNREFFYVKYKYNPDGICGMNPTPVKRVIEDKQQYPYERFVENNKHNIKTFDRVVMNYE